MIVLWALYEDLIYPSQEFCYAATGYYVISYDIRMGILLCPKSCVWFYDGFYSRIYPHEAEGASACSRSLSCAQAGKGAAQGEAVSGTREDAASKYLKSSVSAFHEGSVGQKRFLLFRLASSIMLVP